MLWPSDGGRPRQIARQAGGITNVVASKDGENVLTAGDGGVALWSARTGVGGFILRGSYYDAAFLPGGGYAVVNTNGALALLGTDGAVTKVPLDGGGQSLEVSPDGRFLAVGADDGLHMLRLGPRPTQVYARRLSGGVTFTAFARAAPRSRRPAGMETSWCSTPRTAARWHAWRATTAPCAA